MSKQKRISLQIIRIIAIVLIIYNHTGENGYELFRCVESGTLWYVSVFLDCICKAGVPLFFMISGALLLGKKETIKDIFVNRVLRYVIIIVLFSFIYYVRLYIKNPEYGFNLLFFIKYIYSKPFIVPYWFLYLYLEFLVILPVLRAVAREMDESGYLLIIVISIALCFIVVPEKIFGLEHINFSLGIMNLSIFYPIVGYGIANIFSQKLFSKTMCIISACMLIINYILAVYMNISEYSQKGECSGYYLDTFSLVPALVIFYFSVYLLEKRHSISSTSRISRVIDYIGGCTLVIYLFEDMLRSDIFIKIFTVSGNQSIRLLLCIPYIIGIIICGILIATILRKIPILNKLKF